MKQIEHLKWYFGEKHRRWLIMHNPRKVIDAIWQREFGYAVDWDNPRNLNEKIQWLICYGDTSQWPRLTDKHEVRRYVAEKGYSDLLIRQYGVWERTEQIDFESLPEKFVLKCNHDSGSVLIVDKKVGFNRDEVVGRFNKKVET